MHVDSVEAPQAFDRSREGHFVDIVKRAVWTCEERIIYKEDWKVNPERDLIVHTTAYPL